MKKDFTGSDVIMNGRGNIAFRDLLAGDILTARNGDLYVVVDGIGNNVINVKTGKYATLNNDLTNPSAKSGSRDIVRVRRWDVEPGVHRFSESMKFILKAAGKSGIDFCGTLYDLWVDEDPAVTKAKADLEMAKKAYDDAVKKLESLTM